MRRIFLLCLCTLSALGAASADGNSSNTNRIAGTVTEASGGASDVVIVLCDQLTGLPLSPETYRPFNEQKKFPFKILTTISGPRGSFSFTNLPPGDYRLVAQKWTGPFKGMFEVHGSVIQLFGAASDIKVPSPEAEKVHLHPPGDGILALDLNVGNSGTLVVLSTEPPLADPILGFNALGTNFLTHILGANVMPYGRTTIVGLPHSKIHAWFFANDNSPGFTSEAYDLSTGFFRAPAIPFVAGWSDGRHDPPAHLQALARRIAQQNVTPRSLLGIDPSLNQAQQYARFREFHADLTRPIELPNGDPVTAADLIALISYDFLKRRTP